jgi:hypothetical protein
MPDEITLESPGEVTLEELRAHIVALHEDIHELTVRMGKLVESHNQVGENVAWLVANTQGIFQMLNDPNLINSMMSGVLGGGMFGGGQQPES